MCALSSTFCNQNICSAHFVKCLQCYVRFAVQSYFPPVQIVLPLIVAKTMELTIDKALPQALLPRVDGQVVEAEAVAMILTCKYLIINQIDLVFYDGNFYDVS